MRCRKCTYWQSLAISEFDKRRQVEDHRAQILNELESLLNSVETDDVDRDTESWNTSCTWATPDEVCLMCGDPFLHRNSNVCDSCWRQEVSDG